MVIWMCYICMHTLYIGNANPMVIFNMHRFIFIYRNLYTHYIYIYIGNVNPMVIWMCYLCNMYGCVYMYKRHPHGMRLGSGYLGVQGYRKRHPYGGNMDVLYMCYAWIHYMYGYMIYSKRRPHVTWAYIGICCICNMMYGYIIYGCILYKVIMYLHISVWVHVCRCVGCTCVGLWVYECMGRV